MEPNTTRRALLAGAGAATAAALAGCAGSVGDTGGGDDDGGLSAGRTRLGYVRVVNNHATPHVAHVLVQRDGDPVHWSSHDLAASDGDDGRPAATVERTWADDPGAFSVYVRLDDAAEWTEVTVDDGSADCYGIEARITGSGSIESLFARNPDRCDETTGTGSTGESG